AFTSPGYLVIRAVGQDRRAGASPEIRLRRRDTPPRSLPAPYGRSTPAAGPRRRPALGWRWCKYPPAMTGQQLDVKRNAGRSDPGILSAATRYQVELKTPGSRIGACNLPGPIAVMSAPGLFPPAEAEACQGVGAGLAVAAGAGPEPGLDAQQDQPGVAGERGMRLACECVRWALTPHRHPYSRWLAAPIHAMSMRSFALISPDKVCQVEVAVKRGELFAEQQPACHVPDLPGRVACLAGELRISG